jgi:hypothetical protein
VTTVAVDFLMPAAASAVVASDEFDTGMLDVGDGTGLATGDGSELSSGTPAYPGLWLEILGNTLAADSRGPIEAGSSLHGDAAVAAETQAATRSDVTSPRETLFCARADVDLAAAASAGRRGDSAVPVEGLLRAFSDAVVAAERAALLFLDPAMPSEQNSPVSARLLLPPIESRALLTGNGMLPVETETTAAAPVQTNAALPIESWGAYVVAVTLTLSDGRIITFAAGATPTTA